MNLVIGLFVWWRRSHEFSMVIILSNSIGYNIIYT